MTPRCLAALLLAAVLPPAAAQLPQDVLLGRLFSSPAERAVLEANRNNNGNGAAQPNDPNAPPPNGQPDPAPPQPAAAPPPPPPSTTLNGVLRRSSGKSTIWLNDVPLHDTSQLQGNRALSLKLSTGRQVILKPGQTYNPSNGAVQEDSGQ